MPPHVQTKTQDGKNKQMKIVRVCLLQKPGLEQKFKRKNWSLDYKYNNKTEFLKWITRTDPIATSFSILESVSNDDSYIKS